VSIKTETPPQKPEQKKVEIDEKRLLRLSQIAEGKDPDAQQSLNDFMNMKSVIERTNLPTVVDCQRLDYLLYAGKIFFPGIENDPFTMAAETEAITYMPRGGEKAKQVVELMKQTPDVVQLQTGAEPKKSITDRVLGRGKSEE
jgi:hypothetical protein